jgi:hypothetical protein
MTEKDSAVQEREALVEMYQAGFLDGYKTKTRLRSKVDWETLNEAYKKSFNKRFFKKIMKAIKKK